VLALLALAIGASGCLGPIYWKENTRGMDALLRELNQPASIGDTADLPHLPPGAPAAPYVVGINDEIEVTVRGRPDLGSQFPARDDPRRDVSVVQPDGTVHLPLLAPVEVAGKTIPQIRKRITERYAAHVAKPHVDVQVESYRSKPVTLHGAVANTGVYYLSRDLRTIGDLIAGAGGLAEGSDFAEGVLVRGDDSYRIVFRGETPEESATLRVLLEPGDSVFFPHALEDVVYVFGEVLRPGAYPIPDRGMTILDALGIARGVEPLTASFDHVFVVRPDVEQATVYEVTMTQLIDHTDVRLRPGDRIVVPPSRITSWSRFWQQLLPFFSAGGAAGSIARAAAIGI